MQTKSKFTWHIVLFLALTASAQASDFIPLGSAWKHRLGTSEASSPMDAWRQIVFDDSSWSTGGAPIGYDTGATPGTAPIVTLLPDPRTAGNPAWTSTYFRKTFNVAQLANVIDLTLTIFVDDGAVAWLNGTEILRVNVPNGDLTYLATATGAGETLTVSTTNIVSLLVPGNNVVAVHAFNGPASSSDFVFEAFLTAVEDQAPTIFSIDPPPSATRQALSFINVAFTENVTGVHASDLLINSLAATSVSTNNPRDYTFHFPEPPTGAVTVAWIADPGINDIDGLPTAFVPGPFWTYTIDTNIIAAEPVISEFMADNENLIYNGREVKDEDGTRSDWLEVYNSGLADVPLDGWYLTDTATNLTKWRIPNFVLGPNKYLLISAL